MTNDPRRAGKDWAITCCVDTADRILSANVDWIEMASARSPRHVAWDRVLLEPVARFLPDPVERELVRVMLGRCRSELCEIHYTSCCEIVDERVFMETVMSPFTDGDVRIACNVLRRERISRDAREQIEREPLTLCSSCRTIMMTRTNWITVDEAVRTLDLLGSGRVPRLTYSLCPECSEDAVKVLRQWEPPIPERVRLIRKFPPERGLTDLSGVSPPEHWEHRSRTDTTLHARVERPACSMDKAEIDQILESLDV